MLQVNFPGFGEEQATKSSRKGGNNAKGPRRAKQPSGGKGKASDKIAALEAAGAFVSPSPAEIAETLAKNVPELSGS